MSANFRSDNETPVAPAIMEAIIEANQGTAAAYAEDDWSMRLNEAFSELFRTDAIVLPVSTGTVANSIALAAVTPPWGSVGEPQSQIAVRLRFVTPEQRLRPSI